MKDSFRYITHEEIELYEKLMKKYKILGGSIGTLIVPTKLNLEKKKKK